MRSMTILIAAMMLMLFSSTTFANECELSISATDTMQFDKKQLSVPASCKEVTLTLAHSGQLPKSAMGHNWVLSKADDMQAIANEGMAAGAGNSYVKPEDPRVIAHTDIIGGGESTSITFSITDLDPNGDYRFFCSFPGHWAIMQGSFSIT